MAFVAQPVDSGRRTNMMPNLMLTYPKVHSYETPTKMQNTFDDTAAASSQSPRRKCSKNETIHSGHFMVSEIDESLSDRNEKDAPNEVEDGFNTDQQQSPDSFYAPVSKSVFDNSLTKLFQCMSLAYNDGKITSPKWKDFKGLKLHIKDKIRLNNIIWRAWHIQYITGLSPVVCQFSSHLDSDIHKKTETILLEGKYWKRRVNTVKNEYKKWRMYYQSLNKMQTINNKSSSFDWENNLPRWTNNLTFDSLFFSSNNNYSNQFSQSGTQNSYGNFYDFTNSREISRSGMGAEFMQPGLEQLQPNVDFMDTFGPSQEIFPQTETLPTVKEESYNCAKEEIAQELFNSLFNNEQTNNSIGKPLIESNNYSSPNLFETQNEMIINNASGSVVDSIQSTPVSSYVPVSKMEINNSVDNSNSYNFVNSTPSAISFNGPVSQAEIQPTSMYGMDFETNASIMQLDNELNSASASTATNTFMPRFEQPKSDSTPPQLNAFQSNLVYYDSNFVGKNSKPATKTATNANYQPYFVSSSFAQKKPAFGPHIGAKSSFSKRARTRSSSVSPAVKNATIKSLLNKPSLVSAIEPPNNNFAQSTGQTRTSVERSNSLPIYNQKKREPNTRLREPSQYEIVNKNRTLSGNYFPATSTSPSSESSYSNSESSQCLPHINQNNSSPQMRKISQTSFEKMSDPAAAISNEFFMVNNELNKSRMSSRFVDSSNQSHPVYPVPHPSSSSSSPINSLEQSNLIAISQIDPNLHQQSSSGFNSLLRNDKHLYSEFEQNSSDTKTYSEIDSLTLFKNKSSDQSTNLFSPRDLQSTQGLLNKALSRDSYNKHSASAFNTNIASPVYSSLSSSSFKSDDRSGYKERRRVCHINAEQKRRCNIKNGFDTLRNLLPSLNTNLNTKISKAAMLHKAADHIRLLKNEKYEQQKEYDMLKQQVKCLNQQISVFQNQLPVTGAPVTGQRSSQIKEHYTSYVHAKTVQNWKFWIFSIIMESLLDSYCSTVATTNYEEMYKTLLRWLDQSCCLITLRRDVLNSLRYISTSTNILTNPESLTEEIMLAVSSSTQETETDPQPSQLPPYNNQEKL